MAPLAVLGDPARILVASAAIGACAILGLGIAIVGRDEKSVHNLLLKGVGITVNTLSPGIIMVDGLLRFGRARFGDPEMSFDEVSARFASEKVFDMPPVGRLGMPRDLAIVACMLASPLSGFITGANYRVDGGQVRGLN